MKIEIFMILLKFSLPIYPNCIADCTEIKENWIFLPTFDSLAWTGTGAENLEHQAKFDKDYFWFSILHLVYLFKPTHQTKLRPGHLLVPSFASFIKKKHLVQVLPTSLLLPCWCVAKLYLLQLSLRFMEYIINGLEYCRMYAIYLFVHIRYCTYMDTEVCNSVAWRFYCRCTSSV